MLKNLIPTLQVEIQNDYSTLDTEKQLVLDEQYYSLERLNQANESLDQKALGLLQVAALILALIGVLEFPTFLINDPSILGKALIAIAFLAFAAMIILITKTWLPADQYTPGTQNWNEIFNDYIYNGPDGAYNQVLINCLDIYNDLSILNKRKARNITWAMYLFVLQIVALLSIALLS